VGTWNGLARWDAERNRFEVYRHDPADPHSLSANALNEVYEDSAGRLWVTSLSGIDLLDRATGRFRHYRQPPARAGEPDADRSTVAIAEDRAGTVWFGATHGGLYRLDPGSEELVDYRRGDPAPEPLSSDYVGALLVDRTGLLWLGTRRGLNRYDTESGEIVAWEREDGLPDDAVLALLEDGDGRIWLSTNRGLSRFDPRTESFQSFGADDGLQSDSFSVRSAYRGKDGELFFGGIHGFNAFYPDRVGIDPYPPPVHVTDFQLFNRPVPLREDDPDSPLVRSILETRELVLDHRQEVLTFELAALHYASPEQNRYAYRLEGFDDEWSYTTARRRFVTYTHLSPGRYVFRAKASNKDGVWNEEGTSIAITVLPAPWRSWWAYTFYALVLVTVSWGWVRSLGRKIARERERADREHDLNLERARLIDELKSRNEELARFNYMVSHDLKSPLITIKNYLGLTRHDADRGDRKRVSHDLDRIETAAERMRQLLEDLFEFTRAGHRETPPQTVALGELVGGVVDLLEEQIRQRGVEVRVADDLPVVRGDRQRLFLVFQNLVENALKFLGEHSSPRVEVGVRRGDGVRGEEEVIFVRDNGLGVEPRYHEQIFGLFDRLHPEIEGTGVGLALVRRIVEVHGGRAWVESEGRGRGSTFCFTLPGT
jgi:signal transduction histidine kinase